MISTYYVQGTYSSVTCDRVRLPVSGADASWAGTEPGTGAWPTGKPKPPFLPSVLFSFFLPPL